MVPMPQDLICRTKNARIAERLSQKTGFHPYAFTVCIIDAIPRNESGKIVYQELAKYYEE